LRTENGRDEAGLTAIPLHFQISSAFWDSTRT
jgi:hypothetical protein